MAPIAVAAYFSVGIVVAGMYCHERARDPALLMLCAQVSVLAWPLVVLFLVFRRATAALGERCNDVRR